MKTILLTQGKAAIVDDADYGELSRYKWYAEYRGNTFYVARKIWVNKRLRTELIHRRILGLIFHDGKRVDHINHDGLDNRRTNIRVCTHRENSRNQNISKNSTSGFKGVVWYKQRKKWGARIKVNYKEKHLGLFNSPLVAALAYNQAATEHFGEFAKVNDLM